MTTTFIIWAIFRAIVVTAFLYECYTVIEEIVLAAKEENFTIGQTLVMAKHMYDKNEVAFFISFLAFAIAIWLV